MWVCLYVSKRRCRWQEVPEVPAVYHAQLKVLKVGGIGDGSARCVRCSRGQSLGCCLDNNMQNSLLSISGDGGIFLFFFLLSCSLCLVRHIWKHKAGPIRTQGSGPFLSLLLFFIFSHNLGPAPPSIREVLRAWLGLRAAGQSIWNGATIHS